MKILEQSSDRLILHIGFQFMPFVTLAVAIFFMAITVNSDGLDIVWGGMVAVGLVIAAWVGFASRTVVLDRVACRITWQTRRLLWTRREVLDFAEASGFHILSEMDNDTMKEVHRHVLIAGGSEHRLHSGVEEVKDQETIDRLNDWLRQARRINAGEQTYSTETPD